MRLDLYLYNNSYTESREKAQRLIKSGCVSVDGRIAKKPSENIDETNPVSISIEDNEKYVSRGGLKLEKALKEFNIDVNSYVCVDIGSSTGGFTDCLLKSGALKVYAFDSGKNQLHSSLRDDERISLHEGFNARYITAQDVSELADIVVMDVSFISQTLIIPSLVKLLKPNGKFVGLVKPQFESGKSALGKNGVVKSIEDKYNAVMRVYESGKLQGLSCKGLVRSPIKGGDGNEEYLIYFSFNENEDEISKEDIKKIVYTH